MPLFNITEIRRRIDEFLLPFESEFVAGLRLVESETSSEDLASCEQQLGTAFPESFKQLISNYDFGNLTIGGIVFGNDSFYPMQLLLHNQLLDNSWLAWWGAGPRPANLILIANSDPYMILLDTKSQAVLALEHGQTWQENAFHVADDFHNFVLGLGTVFLERIPHEDNRALADEVALAVGVEQGNRFWQYRAA